MSEINEESAGCIDVKDSSAAKFLKTHLFSSHNLLKYCTFYKRLVIQSSDMRMPMGVEGVVGMGI